MSWVLSAIVVCGTLAVFAAGTLGDKTFGFPYLGRTLEVDITTHLMTLARQAVKSSITDYID